MKVKHSLSWRFHLFLLFMVWLYPKGTLSAQTGITGNAEVVLQVEGVDCNDLAPIIGVYVDVTGLSGLGGDVGLNAFILTLDINRTDVYASAQPGDSPDLEWSFYATNRVLVDMNNRLALVGSIAESSVPDGPYHTCSIFLSGTQGEVQLSINPDLSSLGSRVVGGDGPGSIPLNPPGPITVMIPNDFTLDLNTGSSVWRTNLEPYDIANPSGLIDILDLVKLMNCGGE